MEMAWSASLCKAKRAKPQGLAPGFLWIFASVTSPKGAIMPQTKSSVAASGSPPMKTLGPLPPVVPRRVCRPPMPPIGGVKGSGTAGVWATGNASCCAVGGWTVTGPLLLGGVFLPMASANRQLSTFPSRAMACSMPLSALMQSSASLNDVKVTKAHGFASALRAKILACVTKPNCWQTSRTTSSVACCPMLPMKTLGCCCVLPLEDPFMSANFTLMPSPRPASSFMPLSACTATSAAAQVEKEQNAQPLPSRMRKFVAPYGVKCASSDSFGMFSGIRPMKISGVGSLVDCAAVADGAVQGSTTTAPV
mmetsp:Transcript_41822/g.124959  ORF Transcript_41822/g.124959 Transcript_41822/m.124959 type:complete len:308 (+) Transcript_41822:233-1156(+)